MAISSGTDQGRIAELDALAAQARKVTPQSFSSTIDETPAAPSDEEEFDNLLTYGAQSLLAGMADTFGTSLGILDDGDVEKVIKENFSEFGDFFGRNKEAFQTGGDLVGMFIPGTLALKAVQRGSAAFKGLTKVGTPNFLINSIFTSGKTSQQLLDQVRKADQILAGQKTLNFSSIAAKKVRSQAVNNFRKTKLTDSIKENVAFELGVFATMNDSQTLYPDEFSTTELVLLNASFPAAFAGAELLYVNRLIRGSAQDASRNIAKSLGFSDDVLFRPGNRDAGVVAQSNMAASVRQMRMEADDPILQENLSRVITAVENSTEAQVIRMGSDVPIPGFSKKENLIGNTAVLKTIMDAQRKSPTALWGTQSIEEMTTAGNVKVMFDNADIDIKKAVKLNAEDQVKIDAFNKAGTPEKGTKLSEKIHKRNQRNEQLEKMQFFVLEADGSLTSAAERKALFQDDPKTIRKIAKTEGFEAQHVIDTPTTRIGFSEDGLVLLSKRGKPSRLATSSDTTNAFEKLSLFDRSAAYAAAQKAVDGYKPGKVQFRLDENAHHTQLDYVSELHAKYGEGVFQDVSLPKTWRGIQDVEFASLNSKFQEFKRTRKRFDKLDAGLTKLAGGELNGQDYSRLLNLPNMPDGSVHPIIEQFESYRRYKTLGNVFAKRGKLEQFKVALQEQALLPDLGAGIVDGIKIRGGMLQFDNSKRPVMLMKRTLPYENYHREALQERLGFLRADTVNELMLAEREGAHLVADVMRSLGDSPSTAIAQNADTLVHGTQRGTGAVSTQALASGENPAMNAMRQIVEQIDKSARKVVTRMFAKHDSTFASLIKPANRADLVSLNSFIFARRQGWDLQAAPVKIGDGLTGFKLRKTATNNNKWKAKFGEDMPENAMMPSPTGPKGGAKPFAMTDLAFKGLLSVQDLGQEVFSNMNKINKAAGRGHRSLKEWWVPPRQFAGQDTVYIVDDAGEFIGIEAGRTKVEAELRGRQVQDAFSERGQNVKVFNSKDLELHDDLHDKAFSRMVDFTDLLAQTGRAKGTSQTELIDVGPEALKDITSSLNRQFESIIRRTRALYFEPQIDLTRKLHQASGAEEASRTGTSIYNSYLQTLYGSQTLNPNQVIGRAYYAIENIYDEFIGKLYDKAAGTKAALFGTSAERGDVLPLGVKNKKISAQLEKQLGEFNPFAGTADFFARTHNVSPPISMRRHMGKLNGLTTLLSLRLFEVGHSILTLTSLAATQPAVIKALRMTKAERMEGAAGLEKYQARIGAYGHNVGDGNGMFSATRASMTGIHFMFSPEGREVMKRASARGFFDQTVAEEMNVLTDVGKNYVENLVSKSTLGRISTMLTDKSERLARTITFMTGYNIAKRGLGMQGDGAAFTFAHKFANDVIGNYSPNNRPRIFQGAVGMPLGLFQTFMWNYYQRIFSYVENKQTRALGYQFFTQAAVFGAQTVPGFKQFSEMFASNYDGTVNPVDGLDRTLGTEASEWFLYGTLSNLPKMFGAEDGVSLYTRGDTTIRNVPTVLSLEDTPTFNMFKRSFGALGAMVNQFRERGGFSAQQTAEILSQYSTNRTMRMMGTLLSGNVVDRQGSNLDSDIFNGFEIATRLTGMRPLKEARKIEAFARIRETQASQRELMRRLRDRVRSDVRGGDVSKEALEENIYSYLKAGGRPDAFAQFFVEQAMKGQIDKGLLELMKVVQDPTRSYDVQRLLSSMSLPQNDPEFLD